MRLSVMKIGRYSNHGLAFSAGRSIASMIAGSFRAAFRSLRNCRFVKGEVSAMWAMKSLTSARLTSIAAAGPEFVQRMTASRNRRFKPRSLRTSSGSDELAMRMQRHQYAEAREQRDHGCAAVADHRQGHPDHRYDAADHAGVDEYIDEEAQCDRAAGETCKGVLALHGKV